MDVVVGTPGRIIDLMARKNLDLGQVCTFCPSTSNFKMQMQLRSSVLATYARIGCTVMFITTLYNRLTDSVLGLLRNKPILEIAFSNSYSSVASFFDKHHMLHKAL